MQVFGTELAKARGWSGIKLAIAHLACTQTAHVRIAFCLAEARARRVSPSQRSTARPRTLAGAECGGEPFTPTLGWVVGRERVGGSSGYEPWDAFRLSARPDRRAAGRWRCLLPYQGAAHTLAAYSAAPARQQRLASHRAQEGSAVTGLTATRAAPSSTVRLASVSKTVRARPSAAADPGCRRARRKLSPPFGGRSLRARPAQRHYGPEHGVPPACPWVSLISLK